MPITAATTTGSFSGFIDRTRAEAIFERAAQQSVVQQLTRRVPLGGNGVSIPVITTRPAAGWVAEGAAKPASSGALALKTMDPKKLAAILVVSAEVVRANPGNYIELMRESLAEAFAVAFDKAALYDQGPDGAAGAGPFSTWINQTTKSVEIGTTAAASGGVHGDLVAGMTLLVNDGKRLSGFALDDEFEPLLLGATDTTGRPLYVDLPSDNMSQATARPGRLLGRPSYMGPGVSDDAAQNVQAFGGDWSQAAWGAVGGITYDVSTEATVTVNGVLTSLWENNLMAIRAEAEYGWLVNDVASFVRYANAV